jgi:outer membrane protein assembly factor BamB
MNRRALLKSAGVAALASLSGCSSPLGDAAPDGDGSPTVNPELQGTPTPGEEIAWTVELANVNRLYPTRNLVIAEIRHEDGVFHRAFDAQSGDHQWRTTLPEGAFPRVHDEYILASSDPFQSSDIPGLIAVDLRTGETVWKANSNLAIRVITGSVVVCIRGKNTSEPQLVGYEIDSGRELWSAPAPNRTFRLWNWMKKSESRYVLTVGHRTRRTTTATSTDTETKTTTTETGTVADSRTTEPDPDWEFELRARRPTDGTVQWRVPLPHEADSASPYGPHRGRFLLRDDFGGYFLVDVEAGKFLASGTLPDELSKRSGTRSEITRYFGDWQYRQTNGEPAVLGGIDTTDGTSWSRTFPGTATRPVGVADSLYANHLDGEEIQTVAHSPKDGTERWRRDATTLSVPDGGPIVSQQSDIVALTPDGGERWRKTLPFEERPTGRLGPETAAYAFHRWGRMIVASSGGIVSYDLADGSVKTSVTSLGSSFSGKSTIVDRTAVVVADETMYGIPL